MCFSAGSIALALVWSILLVCWVFLSLFFLVFFFSHYFHRLIFFLLIAIGPNRTGRKGGKEAKGEETKGAQTGGKGWVNPLNNPPKKKVSPEACGAPHRRGKTLRPHRTPVCQLGSAPSEFPSAC